MKALIVGGGTGGHIYPAIAIAQAIQDRIIDSQILFVGSEEGLEINIIPKERFSLATIKARGMLRKLSYRSISAPFMAIAGFFESLGIIKNFQPNVIIATGGFVSLPVILAGFILRVPVVLHEANVVPGITSRICKWFAARILISFDASRKYFKWRKVYCVGNPVRKEIISSVKSIAIQNLGLRQDQKVVLVMGGSQGARSINKAVMGSLQEISGMNIQLLHVCGERDHQWVKENVGNEPPFYKLIPYMHNVWDGLAAADIIISRAGATAIAEIIARGLPSVLVPFPFSSERHQEYNAKVLVDAGAAIMINDRDLTNNALAAEIKDLLNDKEKYAKMHELSLALGKPNAAKETVDIIMNLLGIDLYAGKRKTKKK